MINNELVKRDFYIYFSHFIADQKEINSLTLTIEHNYCASDASKEVRQMKACSSCECPLEFFPCVEEFPPKSKTRIPENKYSYGQHKTEV
jgi:hypothetical protein